jgi:hypothetical protein
LVVAARQPVDHSLGQALVRRGFDAALIPQRIHIPKSCVFTGSQSLPRSFTRGRFSSAILANQRSFFMRIQAKADVSHYNPAPEAGIGEPQVAEFEPVADRPGRW